MRTGLSVHAAAVGATVAAATATQAASRVRRMRGELIGISSGVGCGASGRALDVTRRYCAAATDD